MENTLKDARYYYEKVMTQYKGDLLNMIEEEINKAVEDNNLSCDIEVDSGFPIPQEVFDILKEKGFMYERIYLDDKKDVYRIYFDLS